MLEDEVENHLPVHPLAVADVQQSEVRLIYSCGAGEVK